METVAQERLIVHPIIERKEKSCLGSPARRCGCFLQSSWLLEASALVVSQKVTGHLQAADGKREMTDKIADNKWKSLWHTSLTAETPLTQAGKNKCPLIKRLCLFLIKKLFKKRTKLNNLRLFPLKNVSRMTQTAASDKQGEKPTTLFKIIIFK